MYGAIGIVLSFPALLFAVAGKEIWSMAFIGLVLVCVILKKREVEDEV